MVRWAAGTLVVLAMAVACGRPAAEQPLPTALPVELVDFAPDGYATGPYAALADRPIELRLFAGWYAEAERAGDAVVRAGAGRTYLAVAGSTGCRLPTGVDVRRIGDDLRVSFVGGTDQSECARPYGPAAVLALNPADVAGVRTVDGRVPVAPDGPGTPTAFHPLGSAPLAEVDPVELGTDVSAMAAALARDPDAVALLARPVPAGSRAFAFLLSGCRDTGAVLIVNRSYLDAEPTGGDGANCLVAEHYLAVLEVPAELVPPEAVLGRP